MCTPNKYVVENSRILVHAKESRRLVLDCAKFAHWVPISSRKQAANST